MGHQKICMILRFFLSTCSQIGLIPLADDHHHCGYIHHRIEGEKKTPWL